MYLKDYKIVPGVIIDVDDPKHIGRVKADAPGLFDSSVMNKEGLPWIYPMSMSGYQRFSKLNTGSKIWIMTDHDYLEFWYWPMFELNEDTKNIISSDESDYDESEVLLSRNMGENSVYIYYSPSQGIVIKQGENISITLAPDNQMILKCGDGQVTIKNNEVYLGDAKTDSMSHAVLGEKLVDILDGLLKAFRILEAKAPIGYTGNLTDGFSSAVTALTDTKKILTKKTYVD